MPSFPLTIKNFFSRTNMLLGRARNSFSHSPSSSSLTSSFYSLTISWSEFKYDFSIVCTHILIRFWRPFSFFPSFFFFLCHKPAKNCCALNEQATSMRGNSLFVLSSYFLASWWFSQVLQFWHVAIRLKDNPHGLKVVV